MESIETKKNISGIFWQNVSLWGPVVIYCSVIFSMSSGPVEGKFLSIPHIDKGIHTVEYLVLSFLLARAFYKSFSSSVDRKTIVTWSILLTICYGVSDELHQYFVPLRQADFFDIVFDSVGAFLGQKVYFWFIACRR